MWQPGWPVGSSGSSSAPTTANPDSWAMAAQQWMKSKELMEQWQQHQYQQHMQMLANAHMTAMSTCIDPAIVNNPPPPPPLPDPGAGFSSSEPQVPNHSLALDTSGNSNERTEGDSTSPNTSTAQQLLSFAPNDNFNQTPPLKKLPSLKSRFSNSSMFKTDTSIASENASPKPLFAAYENVKVSFNISYKPFVFFSIYISTKTFFNLLNF